MNHKKKVSGETFIRTWSRISPGTALFWSCDHHGNSTRSPKPLGPFSN